MKGVILMQFESYIDDRLFSPSKIAEALRTTKAEISETLGLASDALTRRQRMEAAKTQTRLLWWANPRPTRARRPGESGSRLSGSGDGGWLRVNEGSGSKARSIALTIQNGLGTRFREPAPDFTAGASIAEVFPLSTPRSTFSRQFARPARSGLRFIP